MRYIKLSKQGKNKGLYKAIVDSELHYRLSKFRWCFSNGGYAARRDGNKTMQMHRFIMQPSDEMEVDHINGHKLDNRRCNLRLATRTQNNANRRISSNNTSGYKGVSWNKKLNLWMVYVKLDRKKFVKYAKTKEEAAVKYNQMASSLFGEYARLNII